MNDTQLGLLGSIVYLGIVTMGTFAGHLYQRINSKLLTLIALFVLLGSLVLFVLSNQQWMAYLFRFLTGGCQVFLLVYYPVWIDKFGQHLKTTWLTLLQICVPVGIFAGYGITSGVMAMGYKVTIPLMPVSIFILYSMHFSLFVCVGICLYPQRKTWFQEKLRRIHWIHVS